MCHPIMRGRKTHQFETNFFRKVLENLVFLKRKIVVNDRIYKDGQSQKKIKSVAIIDDLVGDDTCFTWLTY